MKTANLIEVVFFCRSDFQFLVYFNSLDSWKVNNILKYHNCNKREDWSPFFSNKLVHIIFRNWFNVFEISIEGNFDFQVFVPTIEIRKELWIRASFSFFLFSTQNQLPQLIIGQNFHGVEKNRKENFDF